MSEWKPIETAPKDCKVLGYSPSDGTAIIEFDEDSRQPHWRVIHDAEDYSWSDYEPTYWMTLPEPPK